VTDTDPYRSKFSSRKFLLTAGINVIGAVGLFLSLVESGDWATVAAASIAAYNLANGYASRAS
jgi:hypothetical protein